MGGRGSCLILRIPRLNKLAIFDLRTAKIAGYVPTGGGDVLFAAGAEKLLVIHPEKMTIQRYRLDDLKLERSAMLDVEGIFAPTNTEIGFILPPASLRIGSGV